MDGDFSALKGRRIERAVLRLHQASEERLWRVTVSTISAPWKEGTGTNYAKVPGAACFQLAGRQAGHHGGDSRQRRLDLEIRRRVGPGCRRVAVDPRRPGGDPGADRRPQPRVRPDRRRGQRVDPPGRGIPLAAVSQPLLPLAKTRTPRSPRDSRSGSRTGEPVVSPAIARCPPPAARAEEDRSAVARHARRSRKRRRSGRWPSAICSAGRWRSFARRGARRCGWMSGPRPAKARTPRAGGVLGKAVLHRGPRRRLGAVRLVGKAVGSRKD